MGGNVHRLLLAGLPRDALTATRSPMERIFGGGVVPQALRGGVVALGNFDGFHLGHQAVVGRALAAARAEGRPALVATFDPHPARLFRPDAPPFALTTIDAAARPVRARSGSMRRSSSPSTARFAAESARRSSRDWLRDRDRRGRRGQRRRFHLRREAAGDTADAGRSARATASPPRSSRPVADAGGPISSTRIRDAAAGARTRAARRRC